MALLTAAAAVVEQGHHGEERSVDIASAELALWQVLFCVACWSVARAGVALVRQAWPPRIAAHPPGRRALLLGEVGGGLMVTTMAVMLGLP
ncbi:hypothetical protein [Streptomyces sp. NPDC050982]|uniref:hypothetical protein n=1 Tax=Streptomyces sp. NPDC050982 TaxID=3154746 RepID=UPI0033D91FC2